MNINENLQFTAEADELSAANDLMMPEVRVEIATLQLLYKQSSPAMFFSVLVAALVTWALWPAADKASLIWWCTGIGIAFLSRVVLFLLYTRARPEGKSVLRWRCRTWPHYCFPQRSGASAVYGSCQAIRCCIRPLSMHFYSVWLARH